MAKKNETKRTASLALLGGVNDFTPRPITRDELATAVVDSFMKTLGIEFTPSALTDDETRMARGFAEKGLRFPFLM